MKKLKLAWKRFLLWIGAVGMVLATFACAKPTELAEPAMQLDIVQLIETAAGDSGVSLAALDVPERYTGRFGDGTQNLGVAIDAQVIVPDVAAMPVLRVVPGQITQETVDRLCKLFLADADMYREEDSQVTQVPWDGKLYEVERIVPGGDAGTERYLGVDAAEARGRLLDRSLSVWNQSDFRNGVRFEYPDGGASITPAHSGAEISYWDNRHSKQYGKSWQPIKDVTGQSQVDQLASGALTLTPLAAATQAQAVFDALGLPVTVDSVWLYANGALEHDESGKAHLANMPKEFCYEVRFVHTIDGIPYILLRAATEILDQRGNGLWSWTYSSAFLRLDDAEIFQLGYYAPLAVTEEIAPDARLLPFEEIMRIFERMLPVQHQYSWQEEYISKRIEITRITLGMMRLSDQGSIERGTLAPAWSFYGTSDTVFAGMRGREQADMSLAAQPCLIINAIDGSVIDVTKGY